MNWTFQLTVKFRSRCCSPSAWSVVRPLGNRASPLRHQAERDRNPNARRRAIPPHGGRLQIGAGLAQVHNLHPDLLNLFFYEFCTFLHLQQTSSGELRFFVYFYTFKLSIFQKFNIFVLFAQIATHIFVQSKRLWPKLVANRYSTPRHPLTIYFIMDYFY